MEECEIEHVDESLVFGAFLSKKNVLFIVIGVLIRNFGKEFQDDFFSVLQFCGLRFALRTESLVLRS